MAKTNNPPTETRLTFGRKLRQARQRKDMTLEDLAESSGLTWSYIGQVELGKRNVSVDNMHRLATGLGMTVKKLL